MKPASRIPRGQLLLGRDIRTGRPFRLPLNAFRRGAYIRGAIGSGKTTLLQRFLTSFGVQHNVVQFDFSGTGAFHFQTYLAQLTALLAVAGRKVPLLRQIARVLMLRHAFATLDDGDAPMPVRFDLLRPCGLALRGCESVSQVVDRAFLVLEMKLNTSEPQIRVLFRRVCQAVLTCLVAARRPISEGIRLLDDRPFAAFVFRQIETIPRSPFDEAYVRPQVQELRRILALFDPDKPGTRKQFNDEIGSTRNALMDFAPGTVLGRFLGSTETFRPEAIAFGRQSLSLTTTITDPVLRGQGFQAVHGMLHALLSSRRKASRAFSPVSIVTDEILWLGKRAPEFMALSRNFNVSYILAFQNMAQWKPIDETMPEQLRSLTNLAVTMRPDTMAEAQDEVLRTRWIRPGGMCQTFLSHSRSRGESVGETLTDSWADTFSRGRSHTRGVGESESESENWGTGWFEGSGSSTSEGSSSGGGHSASQQFSASNTFGESDGSGTGVAFSEDGTPRFSEREMHGGTRGGSVGQSDGVSDSESWGENHSDSTFANAGTTGSEGRGRGRGWSRTETEGESEAESHTKGNAIANARSQQTGAAVSEVLNIVSFDEQMSMYAQDELRRKRHRAHVLYDGEGAIVDLARAIEYPAELVGVPILEEFRDVQARVFESRAVPRLAYDPQSLLVGLSSSTPAQPAVLASAAEPTLTPGAPEPAATVPRRPMARGRADRNRR
jgi:hypothetical protein